MPKIIEIGHLLLKLL